MTLGHGHGHGLVAKVCTTGSIRWAWGLSRLSVTRTTLVKFNENIVRQMLR